jgi:hypothetical protein
MRTMQQDESKPYLDKSKPRPKQRPVSVEIVALKQIKPPSGQVKASLGCGTSSSEGSTPAHSPRNVSSTSLNIPSLNLQGIDRKGKGKPSPRRSPRFVKQSSLGSTIVTKIDFGHYLCCATECPQLTIATPDGEITGNSMYELFIQACTGESINTILELTGAKSACDMTTKVWKKFIKSSWRDKIVINTTLQIVCARIAVDAKFLPMLLAVDGQIHHYPVRTFGLIYNQLRLMHGRLSK